MKENFELNLQGFEKSVVFVIHRPCVYMHANRVFFFMIILCYKVSTNYDLCYCNWEHKSECRDSHEDLVV